MFNDKKLRTLIAATALMALAACGGGGGGGADSVDPAAPTPPPWGSLTLSGGDAVVGSIARVEPNSVPVHTGRGPSDPRAVFWTMDNASDARATSALPAQRRIAQVIVGSDLATSGSLVGLVIAKFWVNADPNQPATVSTIINCGGAGATGLYADFPRSASCDNITVDYSRRAVRFTGAAFPDSALTIDGELTYADNTPRAGTTGTSAALASCSFNPNVAVVAPPSADAACLAGRYVGISDMNRECTVAITAGAGSPVIDVQIDGFAASYRHFALSEDFVSDLSSPLNGPLVQRTWESYFTPNPVGNVDPATIQDYMIVSHTDLPVYAGVTAAQHGISFLLGHSSAPAGVAGPFDIKSCFVPML
jgi:hypothetical protein